MRKNYQRHFASMATHSNEKGFTLVSVLFAMSIVLMILPFIVFIYSSLDQTSHYNEFSVRQFFHFLSDEIHSATFYSSTNSSLELQQTNGEIVTIEHYDNLVRRQVAGKGHEILVREITEMAVKQLKYGVQISITTSEGDIYAKTISFY